MQQWLTGFALVGCIGAFLQIGRNFDKEDDPKISALKAQFGRWLAGQGTGDLTAEVQQTSQAFFAVFDRIFGGRSTLVERGIWTGLLFSPAMLLLIRVTLLVAPSEALAQTTDLLFLSIIMAILFTSFAILGILLDSFTSGAAFGFVAILVGIVFATLVGGINGGTNHRLGAPRPYGGLAGGLGEPLVDILGIVSLGVGVALGAAGMRLMIRIPFPVHPVKALASSLGFMVLVGLLRWDDAQGFLNAAGDSGLKSLSIVAFNMFADGVSLLETRWVIQRAGQATIPRLAALLLFDLVASAAIFLTLPLLLGELPDFLRGALFQGERPWLGIFFWTTFSTSFIFYGFVAAVFLFVVPKHGVARAFQRVVGSFVTLEERPFTAVAMAMSLVVLGAAIVGGVYGLLGG